MRATWYVAPTVVGGGNGRHGMSPLRTWRVGRALQNDVTCRGVSLKRPARFHFAQEGETSLAPTARRLWDGRSHPPIAMGGPRGVGMARAAQASPHCHGGPRGVGMARSAQASPHCHWGDRGGLVWRGRRSHPPIAMGGPRGVGMARAAQSSPHCHGGPRGVGMGPRGIGMCAGRGFARCPVTPLSVY